MLKYNEQNNNFNGKYIERNINLLINIDISPIELDKTNITYKLSNPEEYKKILECFIEFFSSKEINVKKEFLYKLFLNEKKIIYLKFIFYCQNYLIIIMIHYMIKLMLFYILLMLKK